MILMIGILFHTLAFTVNTIAFLCVFNLRSTTQNGRNLLKCEFWHMLSAYFTTLMNFKNFKNGIMGFYSTQANYLHNKLRIKFSMSPYL